MPVSVSKIVVEMKKMSRRKAMSGKDAWGIYWFLKEKDFENGRVNYIIHKGDKKDQCNKDMFWLIKDSKEAWVVSGDCKVYTNKVTAEEAAKKK